MSLLFLSTVISVIELPTPPLFPPDSVLHPASTSTPFASLPAQECSQIKWFPNISPSSMPLCICFPLPRMLSPSSLYIPPANSYSFLKMKLNNAFLFICPNNSRSRYSSFSTIYLFPVGCKFLKGRVMHFSSL